MAVHEYAVIKNRTNTTVEYLYDGVVHQVKPGECATVDAEIAMHLFTLDKCSAFDAHGQRVRLLGLEEAPDGVLQRVDPECLDCSPVEIGTQPGYRSDLTEGPVRLQAVKNFNPRELHERQPVPADGGFKTLQ